MPANKHKTHEEQKRDQETKCMTQKNGWDCFKSAREVNKRGVKESGWFVAPQNRSCSVASTSSFHKKKRSLCCCWNQHHDLETIRSHKQSAVKCHVWGEPKNEDSQFTQWSGFGNDDILRPINQFQSALQAHSGSCLQHDTRWVGKPQDQFLQQKQLREETGESYLDWAEHGTREKVPKSTVPLPASKSESEREFSNMKMIKSNWCSSLKTSTLADLMTVKLHSPATEHHNPTQLWASPRKEKCRIYKRKNTSATSTAQADNYLAEKTESNPHSHLLKEGGLVSR